MNTIVYTLEHGHVGAIHVDDQTRALLLAEHVERRGGLASVVRDGRVVRRPGLTTREGNAT
jgi:hypothetical protein